MEDIFIKKKKNFKTKNLKIHQSDISSNLQKNKIYTVDGALKEKNALIIFTSSSLFSERCFKVK